MRFGLSLILIGFFCFPALCLWMSVAITVGYIAKVTAMQVQNPIDLMVTKHRTSELLICHTYNRRRSLGSCRCLQVRLHNWCRCNIKVIDLHAIESNTFGFHYLLCIFPCKPSVFDSVQNMLMRCSYNMPIG